MATDLSKPLGKDAREKLIDFIESCIETLRGQSFQEGTNDTAKERGIALLRTDIDIMLMFISIKMMYSEGGVQLLRQALSRKMGSREVAGIIVRLVEEGRSIELGARNS